jgi:hypothetical protein
VKGRYVILKKVKLKLLQVRRMSWQARARSSFRPDEEREVENK